MVGVVSNCYQRKGNEWEKKCPIHLNGYPIEVDLNIVPLVSYDLLIGMEKLEKHRFVINCLKKTLNCMGMDAKNLLIRAKPKPIKV